MAKPTDQATTLACRSECPREPQPYPLSENIPPRKITPLNSSFLTLGLLFRSLPWVSDTLKSVCTNGDDTRVVASRTKRRKPKWHRKSPSQQSQNLEEPVILEEPSEKVPETPTVTPCIVVTDIFGNSVTPSEEELEEAALAPSSSTFFDGFNPAHHDGSWLSVFEPLPEDDSDTVGSEESDSGEGGYLEEEDMRFLASIQTSRSIHSRHLDISAKTYPMTLVEDVDIDAPEMDPFFSPSYAASVASLANQSFPKILQLYVARHCQGTFAHPRKRLKRQWESRRWMPPGPSSLRFQVDEDLSAEEFFDFEPSPCDIPLPGDDASDFEEEDSPLDPPSVSPHADPSPGEHEDKEPSHDFPSPVAVDTGQHDQVAPRRNRCITLRNIDRPSPPLPSP